MKNRTFSFLAGIPALLGGSALFAWTLGLATMFARGGGLSEMTGTTLQADVRQSEAIMLWALFLVSLVVMLLGHFLLYPGGKKGAARVAPRTWRILAGTLFVLSVLITLVLMLRGFWTDLGIPLMLAALGFWCVAASQRQAAIDRENLHPGVRAALELERD